MSTIINNISFEITNLTMTTSGTSPINFRGQAPQYTNINSATIEMTATTSSSNYVSLLNWFNPNQNVRASTYKFDTLHKGYILKGVFPTNIEYNSYDNDINVNFSVDYAYFDDDTTKELRKQKERKEKKN